MTNAVSTRSYPAARKDPRQARQRAAASTAALVAALAGLGPMAKRAAARGGGGGGGSNEGQDKVGGAGLYCSACGTFVWCMRYGSRPGANNLRQPCAPIHVNPTQLAEAVLALGGALLEDQADSPAAARGAAEVTAAACCIGGPAFALQQVTAGRFALLPGARCMQRLISSIASEMTNTLIVLTIKCCVSALVRQSGPCAMLSAVGADAGGRRRDGPHAVRGAGWQSAIALSLMHAVS